MRGYVLLCMGHVLLSMAGFGMIDPFMKSDSPVLLLHCKCGELVHSHLLRPSTYSIVYIEGKLQSKFGNLWHSRFSVYYAHLCA